MKRRYIAMLTDLQRYREAWTYVRITLEQAAQQYARTSSISLLLEMDRLIPPTEER